MLLSNASYIDLGNNTLSVQERQAVEEYASKLSATIQSVSQEHKDIHASISKYGRIIDKVRCFYCVH